MAIQARFICGGTAAAGGSGQDLAQMVDDPSSWPELFPTEKAQEKERKRLFKIIEDMVQWENTTNEEVLQRARDAIWDTWRRTCAENADHPRARELFDRDKLPAFHDPFAGGGSLPLEAQRLGLEAYASDLNPVAVLICKAMIEIPPKFAGLPPVNPEARKEKRLLAKHWRGAQGLAEDVRYYGKWMRDKAEREIGHLYPKIEITREMVAERPDLAPHVGRKLSVIAWVWARTVKSPNPAFAEVDVPLATTFMLSTKQDKEAYVEPVIENGGYRFAVRVGRPKNPEGVQRGTKSGGSHSSFLCLVSGAPIPFAYIRNEGMAGRMGHRLMTIVAEGERGRVYLSPTSEMEAVARKAHPLWKPDVELSGKCRVNLSLYGFDKFGDLFTTRQLLALTTFSDLTNEARAQVERDAVAAGLPDDALSLAAGGRGALAYAEAVGIDLAFAVDYGANYWSTIATPAEGFIRGTFSRQALPMTWDFAEAPPFGSTSGNWLAGVDWIAKATEMFLAHNPGFGEQADATSQAISADKLVSTDPPYYDNIGYADLSDFFYVWLRRSLRAVFPDLFSTLAVPKVEELARPTATAARKRRSCSF
jgi:putative DNA methylase